MKSENEQSSNLSAYLKLHIAVILYGVTAILGKAITLNTFMLVWWRMVIAIAFFLIFFLLKGKTISTIFKDISLKIVGVGFIIGIHWYCFYGAVKLSHVSVALMCMSLTTLFTSMLEPLILKNKFDKVDFFISLLFIPLMYWLIDGVKDFNLMGFIIGVFAALFAAVFSLYNKSLVKENIDASMLSLYEFIGVLAFCTPLACYYFYKDGVVAHSPISIMDIGCITILAIVCTNLAYLISMQALKKVEVFQANLIVGLEPVYGIMLSFIFFKENKYLSINFYLAAIFIFILSFMHPYIKRKLNKII